MEKITFNRKQVYDLVWSESLLSLSKKYNISDVGLRKACLGMDIPLPVAGYWTKVQHGLNPPVKALPEGTNYGRKELTLYLREIDHPATKEGLTPIEAMQQLVEHDNPQEIVVKAELSNPDRLIIAAQESLSKRSKYYKIGDILHTESGQLNISVSESQMIRALCIMDAVVKLMQKRGHSFKFKDRVSYLVIGNEEIEISLRETSTAIITGDKWKSRTLQPNGKLELKFSHYSQSTTGRDGKVLLEQQLAKITARVELLADELRVQSEENRIWRLQYEEKERLSKERTERKKMELASFKNILQDCARWQEVTTLRNYIDAVESKSRLSGDLAEETQAWIKWARKKADWYDPLVETPDDWLDDSDRTKIKEGGQPRSDLSFFGNSSESIAVEKPKWPLLPWYLKNK